MEPEKKDAVLYVRCTQELHEAVTDAAINSEISQNEFCVMLLKLGLAEWERETQGDE